MNKKQYIFLFLLTVLLYLSYNIISHEYNRYSMNIYIDKQLNIIEKLEEDIKKGDEKIDYISSIAYQVKTLKAEDQKKLKSESVIYFNKEKTYNKFKTVIINTKEEKKPIIEEGITSGMTNFEKWIYFIFNEDIR